MRLTSRPGNRFSICPASTVARSSMPTDTSSEMLLEGMRAESEDVLPLDGTFPMRTSTPIASNASLIPTQYEN